MKKGDIVEYVGCSDEQVRWGNNDDPRSFLIIGKHYTTEKGEVHSQHTKVKLEHKEGMFNSVCFNEKGISVATARDWEDFWYSPEAQGSWGFNSNIGTRKWR